jgi:hypothetical protein
MRSTDLFSAAGSLAVVAALAGCGDPLSLNPAIFSNREDTVKLWAATETPIHLPSGYVIVGRTGVRLDQVSGFDFIYDISPEGRRVLVPYAALVPTSGTSGTPGLQATSSEFDAIAVAEQVGYVLKDSVDAVLRQVYYVRSTLDPGCSLRIPYYAKLEVLGFDSNERSVTFRILTDINCGYRGLQPGLPTQ